MIEQFVDLDRFSLDDLDSQRGRSLVARCRDDLATSGMFSLERFIRPEALKQCVADIEGRLNTGSFTHRRTHNIYFDDGVTEIPPDHPALKRVETVNHTICADQISGSLVCRVYEWAPLAEFLALTLGKEHLFLMADPLARVNVLAYREGEALNWHFDRSEFTTTLLLQEPESGGTFQYRRSLHSEDDPNYAGVADLISGANPSIESLLLSPGTLNVFKGRYTAHRITPVVGNRNRIVSVFSFYDEPGVTFSDAERTGFYGRSETINHESPDVSVSNVQN